MPTLKKNLTDITDHSDKVIRGYLNLLKIKFTEKFALILAVLGTLFFLALLLLLIVIFLSFTLAVFLNLKLESEYLGFLITAGIYVVIIILALIKTKFSATPLFTNFIIKILLPVLGVKTEFSKNRKGLKHQAEKYESQIDANSQYIKADLQLLKYSIWETFVTEFIGLFKSKKKTDSPTPKDNLD